MAPLAVERALKPTARYEALLLALKKALD